MRVLSLLLVLTSPLSAQSLRWTRGHTAQATLTTGLIAADCLQTAHRLQTGSQETNPFLGAHPSAGHLATMCTLGAATNLVVAWAVPAQVRRWWFWGVAGLETLALVVSR